MTIHGQGLIDGTRRRSGFQLTLWQSRPCTALSLLCCIQMSPNQGDRDSNLYDRLITMSMMVIIMILMVVMILISARIERILRIEDCEDSED